MRERGSEGERQREKEQEREKRERWVSQGVKDPVFYDVIDTQPSGSSEFV